MSLEQYLKEKKISPSEFGGLDLGSAASELEALVAQYRPSAAVFREIVTRLHQVSLRDEARFEELLAEECAGYQPEVSTKVQLAALRESVNCLRYPKRAQTKARLAELQSSIRKSVGVKLDYPANLEGKELEVTLRLKSAADATELGQKLLELAESAEFAEMFGALTGDHLVRSDREEDCG